ncbi:ImmA/IrrE family metallo-endopeptidase [Kiloniella sp.]|uniref:ImmA/IrrE family metallo-endopeptidase n=1 Tax=Kiloniella sp. TaxID=1938587 RepID=UPI003A8F7A24
MIINPFEIVTRHVKADTPVNLDALASDLGVSIKRTNLDDDIAGMIERNADGTYTVSVNEDQHPNRQRFTIAHELGHFVLHKKLIGDGVDDTKMYRSTDAGKYHNKNFAKIQETEANQFAATLLMPTHLIKKYLELGVSEASILSGIFGVSEQAMEIRLRSFP